MSRRHHLHDTTSRGGPFDSGSPCGFELRPGPYAERPRFVSGLFTGRPPCRAVQWLGGGPFAFLDILGPDEAVSVLPEWLASGYVPTWSMDHAHHLEQGMLHGADHL